MKISEAKYNSKIDLTKYIPNTAAYQNVHRLKKQGEQILRYIKKIALLRKRNSDLKIAIKFLEGRLISAIEENKRLQNKT